MSEVLDRIAKRSHLEGSCLIFDGCKNRDGYGRIGVLGKIVNAHRAAYIAQFGGTDLNILHSCDRRDCVNLMHLRAGTQAENAQDALERGRHAQRNKTHCKHGHPLSGGNLLMLKTQRACRTCRRAALARYRAKGGESNV